MRHKGINIVCLFLVLASCNNIHHQNPSKRKDSDGRFIFLDKKKYYMNLKECDSLCVFFDYWNNTGKTQQIECIKTSCDCINVKYNHKPIKPNDSGKIKVVIDLKGQSGIFSKIIGVYFQGEKPVVLKVIGKINST